MTYLKAEGVETTFLAFDVPPNLEAQEQDMGQLAEYLANGWTVVASGGGDTRAWLILARPRLVPASGIEVPTVDVPWPITRPPGSGGRPA